MDNKPIEYEDLLKQLAQFRLDVIQALAEIDVEINALQEASVSSDLLKDDDLKHLRDDSRKLLGKFVAYHAQRISPLHERR